MEELQSEVVQVFKMDKTRGVSTLIHSVVWEDHEPMAGGSPAQLVLGDNERVKIFDFEQETDVLEIKAEELEGDQGCECMTVKRDPHDTHLLALGVEDKVYVADTRKAPAKVDLSFVAHQDQVLDLAYNTSKLHTLVTSGTDGAMRVWDLRKTDRSVLTFDDDHSGHWIGKVRYNPFHDQLILAASTSTFVSLYRASSVSTQPSPSQYGFTDLNNTNTFNMSLADSTSNISANSSFNMNNTSMNRSINSTAQMHSGGSAAKSIQDKCVQRYELEDSVTALEWSAADAWIFGALSYNGIFSVNTVPSKEKYRILL